MVRATLYHSASFPLLILSFYHSSFCACMSPLSLSVYVCSTLYLYISFCWQHYVSSFSPPTGFLPFLLHTLSSPVSSCTPQTFITFMPSLYSNLISSWRLPPSSILSLPPEPSHFLHIKEEDGSQACFAGRHCVDRDRTGRQGRQGRQEQTLLSRPAPLCLPFTA